MRNKDFTNLSFNKIVDMCSAQNTKQILLPSPTKPIKIYEIFELSICRKKENTLFLFLNFCQVLRYF